MSTFKDMIAAAEHVMTHCDLPDGLSFLPECAGVILLKTTEGGFVFSGCDGGGLLLSHKEGTWSNPAAVQLFKLGAGGEFLWCLCGCVIRGLAICF
jgi:lipid-binding SYLF domain-containing protein